MLLVLGCFTSFVYAFGENSFITHLVLSPKRLAFLRTPCSATMLLTEVSQVRVLFGAPYSTNPNLMPIGEGFGFVVFFDYPNFNAKM